MSRLDQLIKGIPFESWVDYWHASGAGIAIGRHKSSEIVYIEGTNVRKWLCLD